MVVSELAARLRPSPSPRLRGGLTPNMHRDRGRSMRKKRTMSERDELASQIWRDASGQHLEGIFSPGSGSVPPAPQSRISHFASIPPPTKHNLRIRGPTSFPSLQIFTSTLSIVPIFQPQIERPISH
jgi:hypothetical protein